MRSIFKALIITSALVAGGSAFANDGSDNALPEALNNTEIAFAGQAQTRVAPQQFHVTQARPSTIANTQGLSFVDVTNLSNGSSR
jgi:hypothetical protein